MTKAQFFTDKGLSLMKSVLFLLFICGVFLAWADSPTSARRINAKIKSLSQSLISSAEKGEAEDEYQLALSYFHIHDMEQGEKWIKLASEKGHEKSMYVYGAFFASRSNDSSAYKWYKMSADKQYVPALHQMGLIYLYGGEGGVQVSKDPVQASEYFKSAVLSSHGSLRSQARLAWQYFTGTGVARNTSIAYQLYLDAGQRGLYRAYSRLALDWHDRGGIDPDPVKYNTYWNIFKNNEDRVFCGEDEEGADYHCGEEHKWLYEVFLHFEQYM